MKMEQDKIIGNIQIRICIPTELSPLIESLKFISQIKPGYKVNFHDKTFTMGDSWIEWIKRKYYREYGEKLTINISNMITSCEEMLNKYQKNEFQKTIIINLIQAKTGILNSIITYSNQPDIVSKLQTSIENIGFILSRYSNIIE